MSAEAPPFAALVQVEFDALDAEIQLAEAERDRLDDERRQIDKRLALLKSKADGLSRYLAACNRERRLRAEQSQATDIPL